MMQIQFADKMVTYETFINDVASRLASILAEDKQDKRLFISQAEAFRKYGRGNVERWRGQGKIEPRRTTGKLEYNQEELRKLSRNLQDYL